MQRGSDEIWDIWRAVWHIIHRHHCRTEHRRAHTIIPLIAKFTIQNVNPKHAKSIHLVSNVEELYVCITVAPKDSAHIITKRQSQTANSNFEC